MSKSLDRLSLLQTFVRIADTGSISAAAREMGLSQPSASRQLAELESRFNAQLMRRTTHDLSLTAAGAELLADARRLLEEWEALEEKHLEVEGELSGKLKVVAPVALGQLYLLDMVIQFQRQHPKIDFSWQLEDKDIRFAEVGCDCWIKIGSPPDSSLTVEPLCEVERLVVAAPQLIEQYGPLKRPADLKKLPFLALEPFEGRRIPLTNKSADIKKRTVVVSTSAKMITNNIFAIREATLAGLGCAVMPRWFIEEALSQHRLIDVLPNWRAPKLAIQVALLPSRRRARRLQCFLDELKNTVPNIPGVEPIVESTA
ncbi:MAG: LysR family transcriptional regulator [Cyanobacteria bacterium J06649_4]